MQAGTSFQKILEEKMGTGPRPTPLKPSTLDGATDPAHLAFLLGQLGTFRFVKPRPAPKAPPPRPARAPHALDERQQNAMNWFAAKDQPLRPDFTARELRQAFRALALRLHPDVATGDTTAFLELKQQHGALKTLQT